MTASKGSSAKTGPKTSNARTKPAKTIDVDAVDVTPEPEKMSEVESEADSQVDAAAAEPVEVPEASPDQPQTDTAAQEKPEAKKNASSLGLVLALGAGVAGGLGASLALPYLGIGGQPTEARVDTTALTQFETSMSELEARVAALDELFAQSGGQSGDVASAVGEISNQLRQEVSVELDALSQDLLSLKQEAAAASAAAQQKPDLSPEVSRLEAAIEQLQQGQKSLQTQLETVVETQKNLETLAAQNAQGIADNAARQAKVEAIMPVLAALETAVDQGGDVQGIGKALRGLGLSESDMAELAPSAVPSKTVLQAALDGLKAEVLAAEAAQTPTSETPLTTAQESLAKLSIAEQLKSSFSGLVTVKRLNEPIAPAVEKVGSPAVQALAQVSERIEAGDFAAAAAQLQNAGIEPTPAFMSLQTALDQRLKFVTRVDTLKAKLSAGLKQEG